MTPESQQYKNQEKDEVSLKELFLIVRGWWQYVLSRWVIILAFSLFGGVLGFIYAYVTKPIYTATTTFVLEEEKGSGGLGNLAGLASMTGFDLDGGGGPFFKGDNILSLYKSRTRIEQTLLTLVEINGKKQLLVDRYIEFNKLRTEWADKQELKNLVFGV